MEIQHDSDACPICGGPLSELTPQRREDVITIISDYYETETQAGESFEAAQYKSHPTAFVSFGQLDSAEEVSNKQPERRFRFRYVLIPAIIVIVVTLAVTWVIDFMTPGLTESVSTLLHDVRARGQASVLVAVKPITACLENGWISADISYTDELGDTFSGTATLAASDETDMHHLTVNANIYGSSIDANLFVGRDHAALGSSVLGDSYYGVRFASFAEDFAKFASAAGIEDVSSGDFAELVRMLDYFFNSGGSFMLPDSTITELEGVFAGFFRSLPSSGYRESVTRDDERIVKSVFTYSAGIADVVSLGNSLLDLARRDESLRGFIATYVKYSAMYKNRSVESEPVNGLLDTYEKALRKIEAGCSGDFALRLISENGRLGVVELSSELMFDGKPQEFEITLDFGQSVNDDWTFDCNIHGVGYVAVWSFNGLTGVPENNLTITGYSNGSNKTLTLRTRWNPDTGYFAVSLGGTADGFSMQGTLLTYGGNGFTLALDTAPELSLQLDGRVDGGHIVPPDFINLDKWDGDTLKLFRRSVSELYAGIYSYPATLVPNDKSADTIFITR